MGEQAMEVCGGAGAGAGADAAGAGASAAGAGAASTASAGDELTACIFNIQKFSLHDGPGVRTTVFFKGCPLHCAWCANPESQAMARELTWDARACKRCGTCATVCPTGACQLVYAQGAAHVVLDRAHCEACGTCVAACPARALAFEGETHTLTYAFTECLKDQDFYEESGGGVTLSGGEALLQPHFVRALVERLHQAGVHVAIETTGYIAPALWHELAPLFDLVLFDVKHGDAAAHAKGTGVSNEQILDNLAWAFAHGLTVLPRVPVIPGFNNTPAAAASIAQAIRQAGGTRAQVLPFHQLGERKYELLGRAYSLAGERALTQEDLAPFCEAAAAAGLETFF